MSSSPLSKYTGAHRKEQPQQTHEKMLKRDLYQPRQVPLESGGDTSLAASCSRGASGCNRNNNAKYLRQLHCETEHAPPLPLPVSGHTRKAKVGDVNVVCRCMLDTDPSIDCRGSHDKANNNSQKSSKGAVMKKKVSFAKEVTDTATHKYLTNKAVIRSAEGVSDTGVSQACGDTRTLPVDKAFSSEEINATPGLDDILQREINKANENDELKRKIEGLYEKNKQLRNSLQKDLEGLPRRVKEICNLRDRNSGTTTAKPDEVVNPEVRNQPALYFKNIALLQQNHERLQQKINSIDDFLKHYSCRAVKNRLACFRDSKKLLILKQERERALKEVKKIEDFLAQNCTKTTTNPNRKIVTYLRDPPCTCFTNRREMVSKNELLSHKVREIENCTNSHQTTTLSSDVNNPCTVGKTVRDLPCPCFRNRRDVIALREEREVLLKRVDEIDSLLAHHSCRAATTRFGDIGNSSTVPATIRNPPCSYFKNCRELLSLRGSTAQKTTTAPADGMNLKVMDKKIRNPPCSCCKKRAEIVSVKERIEHKSTGVPANGINLKAIDTKTGNRPACLSKKQ